MKTKVKLLALFLAMVIYCQADINDDPKLMSKYLHESPYIVLTSDYHTLYASGIEYQRNKIIDIRDTKEFNNLKEYFKKNSINRKRYLFINRLAESQWTFTGKLNDTNVTHFVEYCFVSLSKDNQDSALVFFYDSNFSIKTIRLNPTTVYSAINSNISNNFSGALWKLKLFDFAIIELLDHEEKMLFFVRKFWDFELDSNDPKYNNENRKLFELLIKLNEYKVFTKKFGEKRDVLPSLRE